MVLLDQGRVVAAGTPEQVFTPPLLLQVSGVRAHTTVDPLTGRLNLVYADDHTAADQYPTAQESSS